MQFATLTPPIKSVPPDLRHLIDQAVTEGRVTRVPTGASGFPAYRWDDFKKQIVREGIPVREHTPPRMALIRQSRANAAAKRRAAVIKLRAEGLTRPQIAERLGVSFAVVVRLIKVAYKRGEIDK